MTDIAKIDPNFKIETNVERDGLTFFDAKCTPFKLYGVFHDGELYRRVPADVAEKTNPGVVKLAANTAGGRVRFITDSPYIVIKAIMPPEPKYSHMPRTGESGFDMYITENKKHKRLKTFVPPVKFDGGYDGVYDFTGEAENRLITINFPLYNPLYELYIGIREGSTLLPPTDYTVEEPMVYYGSSITQGGCASRPGTSYEAIISRRYDANYINLGFSGNGKGETAMAEYIASLSMSCFVYDYDHNAPTLEHYEKTHEPFFKVIREKHPDLPIVIMTRPKGKAVLSEVEYKRIDVARATYDNAVARGDKNVYFIPGYELAHLESDEGTVDGTHPTDLGFYFMAERLSETLDVIFSK